MSASTAPYQPLLSEEEHSGEEDESPPVVKHTIKATRGGHAVTCVPIIIIIFDTLTENRWNHIEDLDGFFSRVGN